MRKILQLVVYFLFVIQISGCALFYRYESISEQPPNNPSATPMPVQVSTIEPALTVPLALMQGAANQAASKVLPFSSSGSQRIASVEIMKPWPFSGCFICEYLDGIWHFTVTQPRPITVSGQNNQLVVGLSGAVNGGAGFNGEIAKWFSLSNKNFGAGVDINFRTGLKADARYCPVLTGLSLDYRWNPAPYVELVGQNCIGDFCIGPWNLDLSGPADAAVRPQIQRVSSELEQRIPCDPIRDALGKAWKPYSFPIAVPYEQLSLNIEPLALYFPGLGVSSTDVMFSGRFDANVSLDPTPISQQPIPLPTNTPLPASPGRFSLAVPISTQYYTFNALAMQALYQKKLSTETPYGKAVLTPIKIEMYPTANGEQLALGISIAVEFQYLFFLNTSGTVWLTARPHAIDGGRRVRLDDVRVTRKFTNPIWNIASVLIDDKVVSALKDGFELDLNPPLSKAETDITAAINGAGQGGTITLTASDVKIGVGRMLANAKAFQLEALFNARVDANLGSIPFP